MTKTANDVLAAFYRWRSARAPDNTPSCGDVYVRFFGDSSGSVWFRGNSVPGLSFNNFDDAVMRLDEACERLRPQPEIGDALYVATGLKITDLYKNPRIARAADEKGEVVVYAQCKRLVAAGVCAWQIA